MAEQLAFETCPLVASRPSEATLTDQPVIDDEPEVTHMAMIKQEATWLALSSVPLALSYFCQNSFVFISMLSVGRLGVNELAAASLSVMIINFTINMPCIGLACALETFCGTAYTAAKDKTQVGFHTQRGLVAVTLQLMPMAVLFMFIDPLLEMIGQTAEVAALCGMFLRVWLLGSWPLVAFECLKRFVQAQGIMQAGTWVMAVVCPIHIVLSQQLVWSPHVGMGFMGAPLATVITNWLLFLGIVGYIACSRAKQAWGGLTLTCLDGIWEFYKLAIPSAAMMACSWSVFELVTFGSSIFGAVSLAAQACIFSAIGMTYQAPAAIGSATATRVGNALGRGKQRRARTASYVSICIGYIVGISCAIMFYVNRHSWGYIFTDDDAVVEVCSRLMPFFIFVQTFDGMNGLVAGILRALGKQSLGAMLAFPSFWVLGVPIGFYLGMGAPGLQIVGLWIGLTIGITVFALAQQAFIFCAIDWRHEVQVCFDRLAVSSTSKPAQHHAADDYGAIA